MSRLASKQQHPARAWLFLLGLVRALTVLFALHLGGLLHDASDVVSAVMADPSAEHEQCPVDGPCDDCPPGCPNCHCGVLGSLEPATRFVISPRASLSAPAYALDFAEAPKGPELPSLFRPPRA